METKYCRHCGNEIERTKRNYSRIVYCSSECCRASWSAKYNAEKVNIGELATGSRGAVGELLVSVDLLIQGFEVFRSVSQSASCDLLAYKRGRVFRVEVTTGTRNSKGGIGSPPHNPANYDLLAVVIGRTIVYTPEIDVLLPE